MTIINSMYPATFRGQEFLIESVQVSGGRKVVLHEFPNSDKRLVEDLGLYNEELSVNATVPTSRYFSDRDAIKDALEEEGYGTFIHPFMGSKNVAVRSYTIDEETTSLGYVRITMDLVVGGDITFTAILESVSGISSSADNLIAADKDFFNDAWAYENNNRITTTQVSDSVGLIVDLADQTLNSFIVKSDLDQDFVSEYRIAAKDLRTHKTSYSADPEVLSLKTANLVLFLEASATTGVQVFDMGRKLSIFNSVSSLAITTPTAVQRTRSSSLGQIERFLRIAAFAITSRGISAYQVKSIEDIDLLRAELTRQYEVLLNEEELDPNLLSYVGDLRASVDKYLDDIGLTAPQISSVDVEGLPLSIFEYSHYGDLLQTESLRLLNRGGQRDPTYMVGGVRLYTGNKTIKDGT